MSYYADLEIARRQQDWERVRELTRNNEADDTTDSGHGRVPGELKFALTLRAGNAPADEVRSAATIALEKLQRWRKESDSDARRNSMALALALLGRADEAIKLSTEAEAASPMARDQLEGAARLIEAATVRALVGDEQGVISRLQQLTSSPFFSINLCAIPYGTEHQAIWQLDSARQFITEKCAPVWERNRRELAPALAQLIAMDKERAE